MRIPRVAWPPWLDQQKAKYKGMARNKKGCSEEGSSGRRMEVTVERMMESMQ
jgi:hypothetical protein